MAILFRETVLSQVLNDLTSTHYTDPKYNLLLGSAQSYHLEAKANNAQSGSTLNISLEVSNDGVTWFVRKQFVMNQGPIGTTPVQFAIVLAGTGDSAPVTVGGCYARFGCKCASVAGAQIELVVEGRDAT